MYKSARDYRPVMERLRARIEAGELKEGDNLPSLRTFAAQEGISVGVLRTALRKLIEQNYLVSYQGKGYIVSGPGRRSRPNPELEGKNVIAFLFPDWNYAFFSRVLMGIEGQAKSAGFRVLPIHTHENNTTEEEQLLFAAKHCAGIIVGAVSHEGNPAYKTILDQKIPLVFLDRYVEKYRNDFSLVVPDNEDGGYQAARHLYQQGYQRIHLVGDVSVATSCRDRAKGYIKFLNEVDIPIDMDKLGPTKKEKWIHFPLTQSERGRDDFVAGQSRGKRCWLSVYMMIQPGHWAVSALTTTLQRDFTPFYISMVNT